MGQRWAPLVGQISTLIHISVNDMFTLVPAAQDPPGTMPFEAPYWWLRQVRLSELTGGSHNIFVFPQNLWLVVSDVALALSGAGSGFENRIFATEPAGDCEDAVGELL